MNAREKLTANRTYYVRTDGNDGNGGLSDSAGGAFLTIQRAMDVVATIDFGGFVVTVQVRDGTFAAFVIPVTVGQSTVAGFVIQGHGGSASSCIISSAADCVTAGPATRCSMNGFRFTSSGGKGLYVHGGYVLLSDCEFNACSTQHIYVDDGEFIAQSGYVVNGACAQHLRVVTKGYAEIGGTITVTGTPALGITAYAEAGGTLLAYATWSGAATGTRYFVNLNSVINSSGGGANYFPGNVAGSATNGGQYA